MRIAEKYLYATLGNDVHFDRFAIGVTARFFRADPGWTERHQMSSLSTMMEVTGIIFLGW
jgi:hypothetical protein